MKKRGRPRKAPEKMTDYKYKIVEYLSTKILSRGVFKTKKEANEGLTKLRNFDRLMRRTGNYEILRVNK